MKKPITLSIPDGYQVPEGTEDGQSFDESVTFKLSGDKLTLIAVNGISLTGDKEGEKAKPDPAQSDLASRYQAAMAAQQ